MALWRRYRLIILYGVCLALLVFILKWLQWRFLIVDNSADIYIGLIAVFFTGLGIWIAGKLSKPKVQSVIVERKIYVRPTETFTRDVHEVERLGLSKRELEVLELMARGMSNTEIAAQLFVSLSTVKTHCASLFRKLDAQRRTQAVDTAKRLRLIP